MRAAERAARWAGAKQKPRVRAAPVDPALAARAREAIERAHRLRVKVRGATLELDFRDEHGLAELVEALEAAAG